MTDCLISPEWLHRFSTHSSILVGFSGGLDSTVLLHALAQHLELRDKLCAVHVHHGLSPQANQWLGHCKQFAKRLSIAFLSRMVSIQTTRNLEATARMARYDVFLSLLKKNDALLLAHHQDDQAETILLQLLRGAGIDGLSGMTSERALAAGKLYRPLLHCTRDTLLSYARHHQLSWVEDESNHNIEFSRNYLRHQVLPLLRDKWPGVTATLSRAALHCQEARMNLEDLALIDAETLQKKPGVLSLTTLKTLNRARLSNVLRVWIKHHGVQLPSAAVFSRLIDELIFASMDALPQIQWGAVCVRRYQDNLYLLKSHQKPCSQAAVPWRCFPSPYQLEGIGVLRAKPAQEGLCVPKTARVEIRFRTDGALFYWRGQTKKLKKLVQQWQIPPWRRDAIPLIYINGQLAAVVGFAVSDLFYATESAYHIELDLGISE